MGDSQGRAVLVVAVEVAEEDVDELNRWYEEEHGPERLAMPGFTRLRRFRCHDGSPRFLAIYDLTTPDAALSPEYLASGRSARVEAIMQKWKRWDREVWVELTDTDGR